MKALADDRINPGQTFRCIYKMTEHIVGNRENAGYQHFLLFRQCFKKYISVGLIKIGIAW